jgi:hypothetical protein
VQMNLVLWGGSCIDVVMPGTEAGWSYFAFSLGPETQLPPKINPPEA